MNYMTLNNLTLTKQEYKCVDGIFPYFILCWGRDRVAIKCPHHNDEDVGFNPTATRNEKWTLGVPLHRRCPNGPAGSEWKTINMLKLN